jgi:hypothetical protein
MRDFILENKSSISISSWSVLNKDLMEDFNSFPAFSYLKERQRK